jgi:hypothetical protein
LPSAGEGAALASLSAATTGMMAAANEKLDPSSRRQAGGSRSKADEAAPAKFPEIAPAKRTGAGRHPNNGARKRWAGVSRPGGKGLPPPSLSPPEKAWHWIVRSANAVLATLSPPPYPHAAR